MIIHLHGGSFKKDILDRNFILRSINIRFIRKVKNVIILGHSHYNIFSDFIPLCKIKIVPNFSEDYLEIKANRLKYKYNANTIKILFFMIQ
jgi:hypothetical protein